MPILSNDSTKSLGCFDDISLPILFCFNFLLMSFLTPVTEIAFVSSVNDEGKNNFMILSNSWQSSQIMGIEVILFSVKKLFDSMGIEVTYFLLKMWYGLMVKLICFHLLKSIDNSILLNACLPLQRYYYFLAFFLIVFCFSFAQLHVIYNATTGERFTSLYSFNESNNFLYYLLQSLAVFQTKYHECLL